MNILKGHVNVSKIMPPQLEACKSWIFIVNLEYGFEVIK
jgi:hypothetical protein